MRLEFLLLLILFVSCAGAPPARRPASELLFRYGEVSPTQSLVQIFPASESAGELVHYFYLQLRDADGKYVDCDPSEISLMTRQGQTLPFKFERLLSGRYYLTLDREENINYSELNFFVRGKTLREHFKLHLKLPDPSRSKIRVISNARHKITFELRLLDEKSRPVELPDRPEILLDGMGTVEDLQHINNGLWRFSVIYPEQNQIMYFSVRAQGVYLEKLFRYQHIEK